MFWTCEKRKELTFSREKGGYTEYSQLLSSLSLTKGGGITAQSALMRNESQQKNEYVNNRHLKINNYNTLVMGNGVFSTRQGFLRTFKADRKKITKEHLVLTSTPSCTIIMKHPETRHLLLLCCAFLKPMDKTPFGKQHYDFLSL